MKRSPLLPISVIALLLGLGRPAAAAPVTVNVMVDGVSRSAQVEPGKDATTTPSPLVFVFHGWGQPISQVIGYGISKAWPEATVVYPLGLRVSSPLLGNGSMTGWQALPGESGDRDLRFVDALLTELSGTYRVDERRVYAAGVSMGGWFTYLLLTMRPERFAGFAAAAGHFHPTLPWAPVPRPVLIAHGIFDLPVASAEWARNQLERLNGCGPQVANWGRGAVSFQPCSSGQPVVLYMFKGGHEWGPGTTDNVVQLFKAHPLAAPPPAAASSSELDASAAAAGSGQAGFSGDGGSATAAQLFFPESVAVDSTGNLVILDSENQRIRKVGADGVISSFTKITSQSPGFLPPPFFVPTDIAADQNGNLFFTLDHQVLKVDSQKHASLVAGDELGTPFFGDGGLATEANLSFPSGLAADSQGNLLIADTENHRVRKIDAANIITTVAGTGVPGFSGDGGAATAAQLSGPMGLALDSKGNLFIADTGNHRVRKLAPDGTISTVAGNGTPGFSGDDGPATAAQLNQPGDLAVDSQGNLFISDRRNFGVRRVAADGTITTVFGGTESSGGAPAARYHPGGLAIDRTGNLFIADPPNHRVWKVAGVAAPGLLAGQPFPSR